MPDICQAINDLQLISFRYGGSDRVVEPHTYGIDSKRHYALRAYQVRGGSQSGEHKGWKLFHREEMHGVTVLLETFSGARRGYKRGDKAFDTIRCQL